ncbi:MBL fold metallo-hydrolase [Herbiconiux sp. CPCC 205763]|uniref:MBL fold metallo-hydrolase n=1 Tax=Herbiconiux aconitum TaxID=2970913 RepID=A0ABT2GT31_9MICO|nr:MBL fold metallo-hydrolase [Herbiconiux aconitum]MCS5719377.1 MBL fold metallo-hydrolase [Herbiconiux aconitum]
MPEELRYEVMTQRREGLTRDLPAGNDEWRWVANTSTLIWGENDAVLVDTFATIEQNAHLIEWIRSHGKNLTAVYLTHGHGDHAFGVGQLRAAFPAARILATAGTLAALTIQTTPAWLDDFWGKLFPGQIPDVELPDVLETGRFELEGHELRVIEAGETDTAGTTSLWVPDLGLVVAGDVVYNATHPYLAETTPDIRLNWVAALGRLKALQPRAVVSGHKQPQNGDSPDDIEATVRYFHDVVQIAARTSDALDFYRQLLAKQPSRANVGSAWSTAKLLKGAPATAPVD